MPSLFDLIDKKAKESAIVLCQTCHKPETAKVDLDKGFTSLLCGCGITIYYYPEGNRFYYKKVFISSRRYNKDKAYFDKMIKKGNFGNNH